MALSKNSRGALFMCLSMAGFTFNDAMMKAVTETLPLPQAIAMRGSTTVLSLIGILLITRGFRRLSRGDAVRLVIRSLAEVGATLLFLAALVQMEIGSLSAIMQFLPLAVTLGAVAVFGEKLSWQRLLSILVGLVGVLFIIRPSSDGIDHSALLALGSVLCVVIRDLATRGFSHDISAGMVALGAAVAVTAMGYIWTGDSWRPATNHEAMLTAGAAVLLIVGYIAAVNAMLVGEVGFVAPFRYTSLLWAIILGWLVFGTLPDALTWAGAALIVGSGLFTLWREGRATPRATGAAG